MTHGWHQPSGSSRWKGAVVLACALAAALLMPVSLQDAGAAPPSASSSTPVDPGHLLHVKATITELPAPPTVPADGACTSPTGCVSAQWGALDSPGYFPDPNFTLVGITYAGAPAAPNPASIYSGHQVLLVSTNGTPVADGNQWKCITCGVAVGADVLSTFYTYPPPYGLPGGTRVLVGNSILDCGPYLVTDPKCTPQNTRIYPIYLGAKPLGAGRFLANGREWRMNPDGIHLAWDVLVLSGSSFAEYPFMGRLAFDPARQRYNLIDISYLPQKSPYVAGPDNQLKFDPVAMIGELRGWSGDGQSILGIQALQSDSVDAWATSLATGSSTALTYHAEYTDPMQMSPNGKWLLADQVVGSGRLDFIDGMEGIPPLTDQLSTIGYVSGIRNNGQRRFFLPWLTDLASGKSEQVNAGGDPNWNAAADPAWLADSTGVVWDENLACGANIAPRPCADSTEPGGRNSRVMLARFPTVPPSPVSAPAPVSDTVPWGVPYTPGQALPPLPTPPPGGTFTLKGKVLGWATEVVSNNSSNTAIDSIAVTYHNFSDNGRQIINGTEKVQTNGTTSPFAEKVTWFENLVLSGQRSGTKVTSPGGFTIGPSVLLQNDFQATGTMTTTINGIAYTQPANGA